MLNESPTPVTAELAFVLPTLEQVQNASPRSLSELLVIELVKLKAEVTRLKQLLEGQ